MNRYLIDDIQLITISILNMKFSTTNVFILFISFYSNESSPFILFIRFLNEEHLFLLYEQMPPMFHVFKK